MSKNLGGLWKRKTIQCQPGLGALRRPQLFWDLTHISTCGSQKEPREGALRLRQTEHLCPHDLRQVDTCNPVPSGVSLSGAASQKARESQTLGVTLRSPDGSLPLPSPSLRRTSPSSAAGFSLNFILKCVWCILSCNIYDPHQFFIHPFAQLLRRIGKLPF